MILNDHFIFYFIIVIVWYNHMEFKYDSFLLFLGL